MTVTGYRWDLKIPYAKRVKRRVVRISTSVLSDSIKGIDKQIQKSRNGTRQKLIKIRDEMIDLYVKTIKE